MDRELVFAVLLLVLVGPALLASGWWRWGHRSAASAAYRERATWHQLWLPLAPAALVAAVLVGWALTEPEPAEPVPVAMFLVALPVGAIWLRAGVRAVRAVHGDHHGLPAVTMGLVRPRIWIAPALDDALDPAARAAVLAHEEMHRRHRDPLRIWLAQWATDLQWPSRAAEARLQAWLSALEMARDAEVCRQGIDGTDLAAAIVAAARLSAAHSVPRATAVRGDTAALRERVARLLVLGLPTDTPPPQRRWRLALATLAGLLTAMVYGVLQGEPLVRRLLQVG